jgi:photosystem II stability/assembly factor-like uncharacterized protein
LTLYGSVVERGSALYTTAQNYVGGSSRGSVVRSDDGGHTWTEVFSYVTTYPWAFRDICVTPSGALLAAGARLYRSDDGVTWAPLFNSAGLGIFELLAYSDGGVERAVTVDHGGGVRISEGGWVWSTSNEGIIELVQTRQLAETDAAVWLGTELGVYGADSDGGWVATTLPTVPTDVADAGGDRVVAVTATDVRLGGTGPFQSIRPPGWSSFRLATSWGDGSIRVFGTPAAGSGTDLLATTNYGATWVARSLPGRGLDAAALPSGTLVVMILITTPEMSWRQMYRSVQGGPWEAVSGLLSPFSRLSEIGDLGVVLSTPSGLFFSEDDGMTWIMRSPLPAESSVVSSPAGALFTSDGSTVYRSDDAGYTWIAEPAPPVGVRVSEVFVDGAGFLYASTDGGMLKSRVAVAVSREAERPAAEWPALDAPAPNPFTMATVLAFTIPVAGPARLDVYDALGRRIATLIDAVLPAGAHAARWAPASAADGVYVAVLRAQGTATVRRLLLAR